MKRIMSIIFALAITTSVLAQNAYTFDKDHARLTFSAKHFGISNVEGIFTSFTASLVSSKEDFSDAVIEMTADVKSVTTEVEARDNHLRSAGWFDAAKYPTIEFKSKSFKKVKGNQYKLAGDLTIHGVTRPVELDVVFNGKALNPYSKKHSAGFTITGELNRNDFGVGGDLTAGANYEIGLRANVEFIID